MMRNRLHAWSCCGAVDTGQSSSEEWMLDKEGALVRKVDQKDEEDKEAKWKKIAREKAGKKQLGN